MKIKRTAICERQRAHLYIYTKAKKCETFLYTKDLTLCKNQYNHQITDCLRSPQPSRRLHTYVKLK